MSSDYNDLAGRIIKDSIVSSIYIDDEIIEPFSTPEPGKENFHAISKGIYESFRKESKSVDFYKFRKARNWKEDKDYLFKNRDLLILDWQLNGLNEARQEETLQILKYAVFSDNLHFVSIYTATEPAKFQDIFYGIKAYFTKDYSAESAGKYNDLIETLDNEGVNTDEIKSLGGLFREHTLAPSARKKGVYERLKSEIKAMLGDKNCQIFARNLKNISKDLPTAYDIIGFCINEELFRGPDGIEIVVNTDFIGDNFVVINHTIVQLSHKTAPAPGELFNSFTDAVLRVCGNLLTLVSLEIRTLLRESSGFIAKDADSITDAILFHQKERKEEFLSILMNIIRNHTSSYFEYRNSKLFSLTDDFWKEYDLNKGVHEKMIALKANTVQLHMELGKLNVFYNELHVKKGENEIIKFGDVFFSRGANGKSDGSYYLCITAHCDCLRPEENIKNNFYFILGQKYPSVEDALKEGDSGHISYIRLEQNVIAIKWNPRPLILNIAKNTIKDLVASDGLNKVYSLIYATTLKENYAQRMANNSSSFPIRVGVDFASLK